MANYALVRNGVAVNSVEWDGESDFPLEEGDTLVPVQDAVEDEDIDTNAIVAPAPPAPPPPVITKADILARINDLTQLAQSLQD